MEKGGSQMSSREETQLEFYERLIRTHHKELLRLASIWLYQRANDAVDFGRAGRSSSGNFHNRLGKKRDPDGASQSNRLAQYCVEKCH